MILDSQEPSLQKFDQNVTMIYTGVEDLGKLGVELPSEFVGRLGEL